MKKRICALCLALALSVPAFAALPETAPEADAGCAPVAQNLEIETYRGVAVGGRLEAVDPDGDVTDFTVTTPPVKGSVTVEADGSFVYTPIAGKRGRDYFGYRATDAKGNVSQEATVIIKLKKQDGTQCYADMTESGAHYAALRLMEEGVFCGKTVAGRMLFEPDEAVSRTEFLAMCMAVTGDKLLSGVTRTGFTDDAAIAVWAKPYVATALMDGVVYGCAAPGGAVFRPEDAISGYEAAAMLDRLLCLTDVTLREADAVPAWAAQSAANAQACDLLREDAGDYVLTRAEAAMMLLRAENLLKNR